MAERIQEILVDAYLCASNGITHQLVEHTVLNTGFRDIEMLTALGGTSIIGPGGQFSVQ